MTRHYIKINNKKNFRRPPSLIFGRLQPEAHLFILRLTKNMKLGDAGIRDVEQITGSGIKKPL